MKKKQEASDHFLIFKIVKMTVKWINYYGKYKKIEWQTLIVPELQAYLCLLYAAGVSKRNQKSSVRCRKMDLFRSFCCGKLKETVWSNVEKNKWGVWGWVRNQVRRSPTNRLFYFFFLTPPKGNRIRGSIYSPPPRAIFSWQSQSCFFYLLFSPWQYSCQTSKYNLPPKTCPRRS